MAESTKVTRCVCGCGGKTGGGDFKPGHDQRLRGMLLKRETLAPITLRYIREQKGEWTKLQAEGIKREHEEREAAAAKAKRIAERQRERAKRSKQAKPKAKAKGKRRAAAKPSVEQPSA